MNRGSIGLPASGSISSRSSPNHLSANGAEYPHRPSIDLLFTSAAGAFRERVIGLILLHAREEGLRGLLAIRAAGGCAMTHRNKEMPEEPKHPETDEPLVHHHLEIEEIASHLLAYVDGTNES